MDPKLLFSVGSLSLWQRLDAFNSIMIRKSGARIILNIYHIFIGLISRFSWTSMVSQISKRTL